MKKILIFFVVLIIAISIGGYVLINKDTLLPSSNATNSNSDKDAPVVEKLAEVVTTSKNYVSFTIFSNEELEPSSLDRIQILPSVPHKIESKYYYAVIANGIPESDNYNLSFDVKDKAGNSTNVSIKVVRESLTLPYGLKDIPDWEGSAYSSNPESLTALVSKKYKLTMDYIPTDTVDISKDLLMYTNAPKPMLIRADAGASLRIMGKDLTAQTLKTLVIASAFRSYEDQIDAYSFWVKEEGQVEADKISARPGFSEHNLGTAVDFVDQETGLDFTNDFDKGVAGKWLLENAYKYGFVQSYPEGKENITGYQHEAWHYRYIGIDNAKKLKESGLTLIEWLEQTSSQN